MANTHHTIGIFGKYGDDTIRAEIEHLAEYLQQRGLAVILEDAAAALMPDSPLPCQTIEDIGGYIDLAIVIGGDGTLLHAARHLVDHQVPLLGVNLGRLGFLTDIAAESMTEEIGKILDGEYDTEERFLLHADVTRGEEIVHRSHALNDVIINKGVLARLIELKTYLDGDFVNSMRADGIIVATPTGSTAYAMSAGGPILHPTLPAMVLVPICPHTLSDRPIVVSADSIIEIIVSDISGQRAHLTFDGQTHFALQDEDHIYVRRAETPIKLIHPKGRNHYNVLRVKLHWGGKF